MSEEAKELLAAGNEMFKSMGHTITCPHRGCNCGAGDEQASARYNWLKIRAKIEN